MIAFIEGKIVEKTPTHVVIQQGGIGFIALITLNTYSKIEPLDVCKLHTHLSVNVDVRSGQSTYQLFGFFDEAERELFRLLISVSGVSSSISRAILSGLNPSELQNAILSGNELSFKRVKGVGPKLAAKIIADLRGKIGDVEVSEKNSGMLSNTKSDEALSALIALGYDRNSARKALTKTLQELGANADVEALIRGALKQF